MVTFAEARQVVEDSAPDVATEDYGYEDDASWFPVIAPERDGGRVPGVSKESGELTWMSSNADEYSSASLYGTRPDEEPTAVRASTLDVDDETYDDEPSRLELEAMAAEDPDEIVERAAGHDTTIGHDELHHYWTRGEGLAKWAESPKPWTTLVAHLTKYVGPEKAKIYASRWFIEVFHYAAGSDKNRVAHGHAPRGHRVGPG